MAPSAAYKLGVLLQRNHRPNEAVKFYIEALNKNPTDYKATYNLAMCMFELDDLKGRGRKNE